MNDVILEVMKSGGPALVYLAGVVYLAKFAQRTVAARVDDMVRRCSHLETRADHCEQDREALHKEMLVLAADAGKVDMLIKELDDLKKSLTSTNEISQ